MPTLAQHMGVDHGRTDILMPQKFLNRADVITRLKQMSGERMAERVAPRMLDYIRFLGKPFVSINSFCYANVALYQLIHYSRQI